LSCTESRAHWPGQLLNILIAQYSTGSGGFEEVLRVQQQLLDYRLNYLQALIDGNMAVAMMQRLDGQLNLKLRR